LPSRVESVSVRVPRRVRASGTNGRSSSTPRSFASSDTSFEPNAIGAEVDVWHGVADPLVHVDHALALAATLPRCRVFLDLGEGHHFFRRRLPEILSMLLGTHATIALSRGPAQASAAP
jgi:hypothetical protein